MPTLSKRGTAAPASPIRRLAPLADAARRRGVHVHHLNIGQPDLPTPGALRRAVRNFDATTYAYSPSGGTQACRDALLTYWHQAGHTDLTGDHFLVTTAGSEALIFALAACLDPGERVLIPEPLYPNYLGFAALLGVHVDPIPCRIEDGYHLPADLERYVQPGTKAILFANPGNPTGTVYTQSEVEAIVALATAHNLFVIGDEVYREFIFEGSTPSVLEFGELDEQVIMIDSTSKRYAACGLRVGAMVSRAPAIIDAAMRFAMARLSPPTLGQVAAAAIGEVGADYFRTTCATYRARRDAVVRAMADVEGITCPIPEGAFYIMLGLPVERAEDFCEFLLTEFQLDGETTLLAPGSGFYTTPGRGLNEVRVAYVLDVEPLTRALEVVKRGLEAYKGAPSHSPLNA